MMAVTSSPKRRLRALASSSEEVLRARGVVAEQQRLHESQETSLARVLARGVADGSLPSARLDSDARWIRALVGQAFDDQMRGLSRFSTQDVAEQVTDFVLRALGHR